MPKLFVFGCSYTQNYQDNNIPNYKKYYIWRGGNFPKTWSELLAEKLGYTLVNYGKGASGNERIFRTFCEHSNEFEKGDMIIFQWSYLHRYDWAHPTEDDFFQLGVGRITGKTNISETTHEEIIMNRLLPAYKKEIYSFMKLIDRFTKSIGVDLFYWSGDYTFLYDKDENLLPYQNKILLYKEVPVGTSLFSLFFQKGAQTIMGETNNEIEDGHFGEKGHLVQANLFFDEICKIKQNN